LSGIVDNFSSLTGNITMSLNDINNENNTEVVTVTFEITDTGASITSEEDLSNKIYEINQINIDILDSNNNIITEITTKFDSNKNQTTSITVISEDKSSTTTITVKTSTDEDESIIKTITETISETGTNEDENILSTTIIKTVTDKDGNILSHTTDKTDKDGNLITTDTITTVQTDTKGNTIKTITETDSAGTILSQTITTTEVQTDTKGNTIKTITETDSAGTILSQTITTLESPNNISNVYKNDVLNTIITFTTETTNVSGKNEELLSEQFVYTLTTTDSEGNLLKKLVLTDSSFSTILDSANIENRLHLIKTLTETILGEYENREITRK
jgi:hypothetical protein